MKPFIVALAGASCSGKSSIAKYLARKLAEFDTIEVRSDAEFSFPVIALDSYYSDLRSLPLTQRNQVNFDNPESLDKDLLLNQISSLADGMPIDKPIYDFGTHVRLNYGMRIEPARFVFLEGLFALYWTDLREICQLKVFVDAADNVCLHRRIDRDIAERQRSTESVEQQYTLTVRPMYGRYVLPTRNFADLIVNGERTIEDNGGLILKKIKEIY